MSELKSKKSIYSRIITDILPNSLNKVEDSLDSFTFWLQKSHKRYHYYVSKVFLFYFLILFLFLFYSFLGMYTLYKNSQVRWRSEENRLTYWQQVIKEHPNYPDAYYEGAVSALRLKKPQLARDMLHTALTLDPLFKQAERLQSEVDKL